jgi:hypothetical protein
MPVLPLLEALQQCVAASQGSVEAVGLADRHVGEHPRRRHDPLAVDRERDLAFEDVEAFPLPDPYPLPSSEAFPVAETANQSLAPAAKRLSVSRTAAGWKKLKN